MFHSGILFPFPLRLKSHENKRSSGYPDWVALLLIANIAGWHKTVDKKRKE